MNSVAPVYRALPSESFEIVPQFSPELVEKLGSLFRSLGWNEPGSITSNLLATQLPSMIFLKKLKLLIPMAAMQNTLRRSMQEGNRVLTETESKLLEAFRADADGHPMILKQGQWTRVDALEDLLDFDEERSVLVSKQDPHEIWDYTYQEGLTIAPRGRIEYSYQLSNHEYMQLQTASNSDRSFFLQTVTNGSSPMEQFDHVGTRLIDNHGRAYSFGFGRPEEEANHPITEKFGVFNSSIYSRDFREFNRFTTRNVTTIGITEEKFQEHLDTVNRIAARSDMRFHFLRQNCVRFNERLLINSGEQLNVMCSVPELVGDFNPDGWAGIPYIGVIAANIEALVKPIFHVIQTTVPQIALTAFSVALSVVLFVPQKILDAMINILILILGGTTQPFELVESEEDTIDNQDRLTSFRQYMPMSLPALFDPQYSQVASPLRFAQWQLAHPNTVSIPYNGPGFYITAPIELEA